LDIVFESVAVSARVKNGSDFVFCFTVDLYREWGRLDVVREGVSVVWF